VRGNQIKDRFKGLVKTENSKRLKLVDPEILEKSKGIVKDVLSRV
jgi:hypothetical protein